MSIVVCLSDVYVLMLCRVYTWLCGGLTRCYIVVVLHYCDVPGLRVSGPLLMEGLRALKLI